MAKPDNWDELDLADQKSYAWDLANSMRGKYIIGQALAYAMHALDKVEGVHREVSNIEDMEMISLLYSPFVQLVENEIRDKEMTEKLEQGDIEHG